MRQIIAQAHDYLGLLLDFHWRESIRTDWRPEQIEIIDGLIHGTIEILGIKGKPLSTGTSNRKLSA